MTRKELKKKNIESIKSQREDEYKSEYINQIK